MTSVSLLLPVYNEDQVLDHVLERLATHTTHPDVELIAVDDGSTDASLSILERWRESGRLPGMSVHSKENGGAIDTLNYALERASGEVVVQLDADASVETPGWLEKMLALLGSDARVGVITAKVVLDDGFIHACGVDLVGPGGMQDRPTTLTERPGSRTWHFRAERMREGTWPGENVACEVDAGLGCCLMYRRADALQAGGYDRGYSPVWFDDIDLCLGIRNLGRKVFYLPDVHVIHHVDARVPAPEPATPRDRLKVVLKRIVPERPRRWLRRKLAPDGAFTPEQRERLVHHYAYWESKWGWHPLNPDLDAIRARWGGTEVAWALDAESRRAGREILVNRERITSGV
jgi:GT2 family glycosyltransferase